MAKKALEPATVLHPHPVLPVGSFGADGKPNLVNAEFGYHPKKGMNHVQF